jgi:iron complex outermembrane recepter protein
MRITPTHKTALAVALATAFPAIAQSVAVPATLAPVIVTANGIPTRDSDATYASEVHDRAAIDASGATSLADYLAQYTSLNVLPGFGNRNAPLLDMRGYGIGNGYQNVVMTVDGRRLNEVDLSNPLLGAIPLNAVDSIEISRGSGSVAFGDGAMAGTIQIRTRAFNGVSLSAFTGSRGMQSLNAIAGLSGELFDFSVSATNGKQGYSSDPDATGHRDGSDNRSEQAKLAVKPVKGLKLSVDGMNARIDTRYVNPLTPAEFNANPSQLPAAPWFGTYTHQMYEVRQARFGAEYELADGWVARYAHNQENKTSNYVTFASSSDYDYTSDDASLSYRSARFDLAGGVQSFKGERLQPTKNTTKDSFAYYLQGIYRIDKLSLSAGVRKEEVEYRYMPTTGAALNGEHDLSAWDVGANYRFSEQVTGFLNYNSAYQAPDIDRFFTLAGSFNGFIEPARSRTLNVGFNRDTPKNRLRAAAFYARLRNEIYVDPLSFVNTNIDKSHKYGLELQDRWQVRDDLSLSAMYSYTRAIIDKETTASGAVDGNELPGVPRHGVTLGMIWKPWTNATLNVNHVWRDSAYAINDMDNRFRYRQSVFSSTSVALRQRFGKIEGFVGVENLFDRANGIWVSDTAVYPVDFRRSWKVGAKIDLL